MNRELTTAAVGALFALMIARRAKRTFGRQALTLRHLVPRLILLPLVCALVLLSWPVAEALLAALLGAGLGSALGWVGFRLTVFETTPEGEFYRPNGWVSALVMALFLGRLAMRASVIAAASAGEGFQPGAVPRSALTTGIIFFVASQAVSSSVWLLRERGRRMKARS